MWLRHAVLAPVVILTVLNPARVSAQGFLDRVVGLSENGAPLSLWGVTGQQLARLGAAAGVPVGFEELVPSERLLSIAATGRPLRHVLDAMIAEDPRYEWRDDGGVLVIRPVAAWSSGTSPLDAPSEGLSAADITANDALDLLSQMMRGTRSEWSVDSRRRFSVTVPDGATWLEMLNGIVRAHGTLGWSMSHYDPANPANPLTVGLFTGTGGHGFGVPTAATLRRVPQPAPERTDSAVHPLDRIVGLDQRYGQPQPYRVSVLLGAALKDLSNATGTPIGFEPLADSEPTMIELDSRDRTLTGKTMRQALDMLVAIDPRYEWRDDGGIVVMRPAKSWEDPHHPLFQQVGNVLLDDVTASLAFAELDTVLTGTRRSHNFLDRRTFSVAVASGTVLDLLNEIGRAHGGLSWMWTELPLEDRPLFGGRYQVTFWLVGGSSGQQHVIKGLGAQ